MPTAADTARSMADAARALLDALDDTQRTRVSVDFDATSERTNWH